MKNIGTEARTKESKQGEINSGTGDAGGEQGKHLFCSLLSGFLRGSSDKIGTTQKRLAGPCARMTRSNREV